MLETSRRLLTRRSSGVAPRLAQVVPGRWRKLCPVSSRKTSVRPSRWAFFFKCDPFAPWPGGDGALIALLGPGRGTLDREIMRLQGALEVARVVAHAELSPDQRRDALQGPALGFEARFRRSAAQQPAEPSPSTGVEPRRSPGPGAGAQPAPAL